jgi:hypothetical protein
MKAVGLISVCIGEINRGDPQAATQAGRAALRVLEEATNAQVTALGCSLPGGWAHRGWEL